MNSEKKSQCLKYEYNMTKAGPSCTSTPYQFH